MPLSGPLSDIVAPHSLGSSHFPASFYLPVHDGLADGFCSSCNVSRPLKLPRLFNVQKTFNFPVLALNFTCNKFICFSIPIRYSEKHLRSNASIRFSNFLFKVYLSHPYSAVEVTVARRRFTLFSIYSFLSFQILTSLHR